MRTFDIAIASLLVGCGASAPLPTPPATRSPVVAPAIPNDADATHPQGASSDDAAPSTEGAEAGNAFAGRLEEEQAGRVLGPDHTKLLAVGKLSPKTQKSLLKNHLVRPLSECPANGSVDAQPAPGLIVPPGKSVKLSPLAYEHLKAAGNLAKQRGMSIELVEGQLSVADAVRSYNHAVIEMAMTLVKEAPAAEQKDKSFALEARRRVDQGDAPPSWTAKACSSGRLGGFEVVVQLVTLTATGDRGTVLVKGGDEGDRFAKSDFEATYWNKPKGKNFRTLTEIMSAGKFVRVCSQASRFITSPTASGSWRCKEGTESWDPENRPIPAWQ